MSDRDQFILDCWYFAAGAGTMFLILWGLYVSTRPAR